MSCRKVKQTGLQVGNLVGVYTLTSVWIISMCYSNNAYQSFQNVCAMYTFET